MVYTKSILLSTSLIFVFETVVVTEPLVSSIFNQYLQFVFSKFCLSVLYWSIWIRNYPSGVFFSKLFIFVFSVLSVAFLATSLSVTSLNSFKSTGTIFDLPTSKLSTFVFKLFKIAETLINLLMLNLSTSASKTIKSFLAAQSDVSRPVAWSNYLLVAWFNKSNTISGSG